MGPPLKFGPPCRTPKGQNLRGGAAASSWRRPPDTGPAPHYLPVIRVETSILPIGSPRGWKGKIDRSRERTVGGGFARPGSHFTVMLKMEKKKRKVASTCTFED